MHNIIVIEAISTGINYVSDIKKRGFHPVIMEQNACGGLKTFLQHERKIAYAKLAAPCTIISEEECYPKTLEKVRQLNPILIVPGTEPAVPLATRLAEDLGLPGNPAANIEKMTNKQAMQQALAKCGLRHIRGRVVKTVEEALAFYDELKCCQVILKPYRGAASFGFHFCNNKAELENLFREEMKRENFFGEIQEGILMQERICGTEYIVNTCSSRGRHRITSVMKYAKKAVFGGGNVYKSAIFVNRLGMEHTALIRYAFAVADAIGIKNGPVHGEYMIDENGPVLIEVNCRPMGAGMTADYLDKITGQHETDGALEAYLDPLSFLKTAQKPYGLKMSGCLKLFIAPNDINVKSSPLIYFASQLKSFCYMTAANAAVTKTLARTIDMETAPGVLYLAHEDELLLLRELDLLNRLEELCFNLLYQSEKISVKRSIIRRTPAEWLARAGISRETVCCIDSEYFPYKQMKYENILFDMPDTDIQQDMEKFVFYFIRLATCLQPGGHLIVTANVFQQIPNGLCFVSALMELAGLTLECPGDDNLDIVIATVR